MNFTTMEDTQTVAIPAPQATVTINGAAVDTAGGLNTLTTGSEEISSDDTSIYGTPQAPPDLTYPNSPQIYPNHPQITNDGEEEQPSPRKKQKQLSDSPKAELMESGMTESPSHAGTVPVPSQNGKSPATKSSKKSKKKNKDIWTTTSRKAKKKTKHPSNNNHNSRNATNGGAEDKVLIIPIPRFPDKNDDSADLKICLSKAYKAEKVDLSDDRLTAGSTKGYRMVRATRGVSEGAWYFEIKVVHLGESGHTRLGWSTDKGDLQAPVGYDGNSFGYRDIDGSKVHRALREKYGEEGYKEDDVIGFYINLPDGGAYAPKPPRLVWYKGQRYICASDPKEDPPKIVPGERTFSDCKIMQCNRLCIEGDLSPNPVHQNSNFTGYLRCYINRSEISFFRNGLCQGVAFTDLFGGRYYPAASMYTLPDQPNCVVKFNFGPDFEKFPDDLGGRPVPRPMIEVPYQAYDYRVENDVTGEKKL
ncbi:hypothetical protein OROHE_024175 [Orobanche hederae]